MQIVINIAKGDYEKIKKYVENNSTISYWFWEIANGIILPEHHGRLIDEKEATGLIAEGKNGDKAYFGTVNKDWEVIDFLKTLSTILEAESEG